MTGEILKSTCTPTKDYLSAMTGSPNEKRFLRRILIIDYWYNEGLIDMQGWISRKLKECQANYDRRIASGVNSGT